MRQLQERVRSVEEDSLASPLLDYAAYREAVGLRKGLLTAMNILHAVVKKGEDD